MVSWRIYKYIYIYILIYNVVETTTTFADFSHPPISIAADKSTIYDIHPFRLTELVDYTKIYTVDAIVSCWFNIQGFWTIIILVNTDIYFLILQYIYFISITPITFQGLNIMSAILHDISKCLLLKEIRFRIEMSLKIVQLPMRRHWFMNRLGAD